MNFFLELFATKVKAGFRAKSKVHIFRVPMHLNGHSAGVSELAIVGVGAC